jgi:uncharacterized membrane protein
MSTLLWLLGFAAVATAVCLVVAGVNKAQQGWNSQPYYKKVRIGEAVGGIFWLLLGLVLVVVGFSVGDFVGAVVVVLGLISGMFGVISLQQANKSEEQLRQEEQDFFDDW